MKAVVNTSRSLLATAERRNFVELYLGNTNTGIQGYLLIWIQIRSIHLLETLMSFRQKQIQTILTTDN